MAEVVLPFGPVNVQAGTSQRPFVDVTSQVAGHTTYRVEFDVTAWTSADQITIGIVFRVDGATTFTGSTCQTTGGVHVGMDGVTQVLPACGGPIPTFGATLEASALITVPSRGQLHGNIVLS